MSWAELCPNRTLVPKSNLTSLTKWSDVGHKCINESNMSRRLREAGI